MSCARQVYPDGGIMWICGSGIEPCSVCGGLALVLCDYPVGSRKTCDQPLCPEHAIKQGAAWQDIHFCPTHVLISSGKIREVPTDEI